MLHLPAPEFVQQSHLQVKTDLNEISLILDWFEQFQESYTSREFILRARIALVEGFTNAVRHAHYQRSPDTPIDIYLFLFAHQLEIHIWDSGAAFDLIALLNTVEQQYPDPAKHHAHWGATIFRRLSVEYGWTIDYVRSVRPSGDRNCLQIQMPR
jgi:serine/threonine-protein kinase RsbW